jgi:hypothetical protein
MYRCVATLVEPDGGVDVLTFVKASAQEAIAKAERMWAWLIDNRLLDLHIRIVDDAGAEVMDRCLDDAQLYYDHRMYRIDSTERSYLDVNTPLAEREDYRRYETHILVGTRDNLDAHIATALRSGNPAITHEYLDTLWKQDLFWQRT